MSRKDWRLYCLILSRTTKLKHRRSDTLYEDAIIATTAIRHQMKLVTRNVADFSDFGVELVNPFETSASR